MNGGTTLAPSCRKANTAKMELIAPIFQQEKSIEKQMEDGGNQKESTDKNCQIGMHARSPERGTLMTDQCEPTEATLMMHPLKGVRNPLANKMQKGCGSMSALSDEATTNYGIYVQRSNAWQVSTHEAVFESGHALSLSWATR